MAGASGKARALLAGPGGRSVVDHATSMVEKMSFAPQSSLLTVRRWPVPEGRNGLLVPDVEEARARVETSVRRPLAEGAPR